MPGAIITTYAHNIPGTRTKIQCVVDGTAERWEELCSRMLADPQILGREVCLPLQLPLKALLSDRPSESRVDTTESTTHVEVNTTGFKTQEAVSKGPCEPGLLTQPF